MIAREDLGALLHRTQRLVMKLGELAGETTGRPSLFIASQVEDLEQDLGRLIDQEMDRRLRVSQFTKPGITQSDRVGVTVVRQQMETRTPPPLSGNWRGRRDHR